MRISITIPGKPIPLKRPRLGLGKIYDSQADIKKRTYWEIRNQTDTIPTSEPVNLSISFFMQIPRSLSNKKKTQLDGKPHSSRPDLDNLIKFYLDVCNGLLYDDDSQIYNISSSKVYSSHPRTEITIT